MDKQNVKIVRRTRRKTEDENSLRITLKKYQVGKRKAMMTYMESSSKNPLHS